MLLTTETILFIMSGLALILGVMGLSMGIYSMICVKAMEKATHTVTYMPVDKEIDQLNEEFLKTQKEEWATPESEIEKQNKYWANDLEKEMPDFAPDEEDKKRIIF